MPRRGILGLWAVAALLLVAGIAAARVGAQEAAPAGAAVPDTTASAVAPGEPAAETDAVAPAPPQTAVEALERAWAEVQTPWYQRLLSVMGLVVLLAAAWALSVDRRMIPWRVVIWGLTLQFAFGLFILRTPIGERIFDAFNDIIVALLGFTVDGASFVFGDLVWNHVPVGSGSPGNAPMAEAPGMVARTGAFFAFNVLPTIIFFSALMTVLYHLGIMQAIVRGMAWVMTRTMRTSGAETLSTAGNVFLGQTEAPLLVKPFVASMTMSELMAVMTGGFATVAGGVMAAYVGMLVGYFPDVAGHLLAASVMSAPAGLMVAKIMYPEREEPATRGDVKVVVDSPDANVIDAAARGAGEGLTLALNVGAMLLAFIALISLINALLAYVGDLVGITSLLQSLGALEPGSRLTLETILGWLLAPVAWIMGVPWEDAVTVGSMMGIKTVLNEFVAYLQLANLLSEGAPLSPRSIIIASYALCGFANFGSIAIQIGGIGGIAPSRRGDLARIGLRAMIAGSIAAFMTATIAGIIV